MSSCCGGCGGQDKDVKEAQQGDGAKDQKANAENKQTDAGKK